MYNVNKEFFDKVLDDALAIRAKAALVKRK